MNIISAFIIANNQMKYISELSDCCTSQQKLDAA